ncbi:serine-rich adhesin for platelets isoform X3 [Bactrocera oleae]|uniref:serine-rich adhesin for platelets isoform X3 n=1 Tax=Bactrocera oleae TaxID=104688 RepID=UPI00387E4EC1
MRDDSVDVMGGGFTSAIAIVHLQQQQNVVKNEIDVIAVPIVGENNKPISVERKIKISTQMQEKLLDNIQTENDDQKIEKTFNINNTKKENKPSTATVRSTNTRPSSSGKNKGSKETCGKFAEKLRRSFRRGEHKSLEIKPPEHRLESLAGASHRDKQYSPGEKNSSCNSLTDSGGGNSFHLKPFGIRSLPPLQRNSHSIFSFSHLPSLGVGGSLDLGGGSKSSVYSTAGGGHINPALLLDSPDADTPPEYAYHHLSSVATTNSSTSLESNFGDIDERTSSLTSISYWAWHQSNSSMGGEVSTNSNNGVSAANNSGRTMDDVGLTAKQHKQKQKLKSQSSSKSDIHQQQASRSCSITSESSSTKLTRLQNLLFKSSNESTKSIHAHSNEGFTASSHNSSSGEWENLGFSNISGSCSHVAADFYVGSFPEESDDIECAFTVAQPADNNTVTTSKPLLKRADSSETAGSYYQYTLTSPNNPFLPEIIARTYHSVYDEENKTLEDNVTNVKCGPGGDLSGVEMDGSGSHSAQLPTPVYSRAGSQESTHSDSAISATAIAKNSANVQLPSSPINSSSSTPGRQRRKLFILNSPTRHLLHQQSTHKAQPQVTTPDTFLRKSTPCTSASDSNVIKSLNPFLPIANTVEGNSKKNTITTTTSTMTKTPAAAIYSATKRAPLKQSAVTSPIAMPQDLNTKREEFLRATMKICLVVSPPNSKLQLKSKSLTHLDGLDPTAACHRGIPVSITPNMSRSEVCTNTATSTIQTSEQLNPDQYPAVLNSSSTTAKITSEETSTPTGTKSVTSYKKKSPFLQRKKPLLTRSEVTSSEYFSVSFCTDQGGVEEEFIPATKGVTLYSALSQALKRRNLTFSQIAITDNNPPSSLLETGYSPLASSLEENTDIENLAGHHLTVTECDGSRKILQKAASFGSRTRPPRLLSSASTEETSEAAVPGKQLKQRWSGLFGIKNPQQSQLCELLNSYAKSGVPQKRASVNFDHPDFDAALEYLDNMHKSWKDIVDSTAMNDSEMRIQTAIWELVTTEVYYIHALQTVTDLFLACLEAVQLERLLTDVDQHRLFSNVRDICEANLKFWTLYLYPMVAHSVATGEPLRVTFFHQGFVAFASIFAPYKKYCAEQSTCQFYCKELNQNNPLFTSYLAWCESQKLCNRLRLADILVRPMQRLTKYSLLLTAIKKHMLDMEQIESVDSMIHSVEHFVFSVNNHLTTRQENERLKGVMARIESYDVVDTNNEHLDKMIKQYSKMFDLCAPMKGCPAHQVRHLFMEGDHKFKDNLGKTDVHCFLLTDMLLVCKAIAKRGLGSLKVIRQPYLTDRLVVQQSNNILNCIYLNEFQVVVTAFTLQCSEAKNWCESIKRAKMIYTRLKQGTGNWDNFRLGGGSGVSGNTVDALGVKKSPMNSSICSHVSSANNSHSGSVEWNDSRNISVDFEKTNSLSSDDGSMSKNLQSGPLKLKVNTITANTLSVQPLNHLGQSLPNLNLNQSHTNNTLLVPGTTTSHSGNLLLSPSHRGISYPPPSPTRVPLRRGMAFSTSTKNPPLVKTRNITSQNSINWSQPQTTSASLQQRHKVPINSTVASNATNSMLSSPLGGVQLTQNKCHGTNESTTSVKPEIMAIQLSNDNLTDGTCQQHQHPQQMSTCNETDV